MESNNADYLAFLERLNSLSDAELRQAIVDDYKMIQKQKEERSLSFNRIIKKLKRDELLR